MEKQKNKLYFKKIIFIFAICYQIKKKNVDNIKKN